MRNAPISGFIREAYDKCTWWIMRHILVFWFDYMIKKYFYLTLNRSRKDKGWKRKINPTNHENECERKILHIYTCNCNWMCHLQKHFWRHLLYFLPCYFSVLECESFCACVCLNCYNCSIFGILLPCHS